LWVTGTWCTTGDFMARSSRDMAIERTYTDQEVALILRRAIADMRAPRLGMAGYE
jgi:hypothetical protein